MCKPALNGPISGVTEHNNRTVTQCECRGECSKIHTSGQCRSLRGGHIEDARHPTVLRLLDGKRYCQSCYGRISPPKLDRYEALRLQTPPWADREKIAAVYRECKRLSRETGITHTVDHVLPLRGRTVSGLHVHENLQILTWRENFRKGARLAD